MLNSFPNKLCLTLSRTSLGFYLSAAQIFWKQCGKRKNPHWKQVHLFPQCFLPFLENCPPFLSISKRCLQTRLVWESLKFVIWERVKENSEVKKSFEASIQHFIWDNHQILHSVNYLRQWSIIFFNQRNCHHSGIVGINGALALVTALTASR